MINNQSLSIYGGNFSKKSLEFFCEFIQYLAKIL